MKAPHNLYGKKLLLFPILMLLTFSLLSALNVNIIGVSAVDYPAIYIDPENTVNSTLTRGKNYTVSIYTNYTGSDIRAYEFTLNYDPTILKGVEVTNGDVIVGGSADFIPGTFNDIAGKLSLTVALYTEKEVTSGPGNLAYVTFTVVSLGTSNITIGDKTKLKGWGGWPIPSAFNIIDAETMPTHIQHGFVNCGDVTHDLAVIKVTAPDIVAVNDSAPIDVTVKNQGIKTENLNVTVSYDGNLIGFNDTVVLDPQKGTIVPFSWNTTGLTPATYTIKAEAILVTDDDPTDNALNASIDLESVHDVAVISLQAPTAAVIEQLVSINVTIKNQGYYDENVNVTVSYNGTPINTTLIDILPKGGNAIVEFSWNTTGLTPATYTINATATIAQDDDLSDNNKTKQIELKKIHDVAVTNISAPTTVAAGEFVPINVTVENQGSYDENVNVTISYDSTPINTTDIDVPIGASETVEFSWNTTGVDLGTYTINATATIAVDEDLSDNIDTEPIELKWGYDVAIMSILAPTTATVGEIANIMVIVKNNGAYDVTAFVMNVTYDAGVIETRSVGPLASGDSTSPLFSWNTTDVDPASYTITAEAILAGDEDLTNNQKTKSIRIIVPPIANFTFSPSEPVVAGTVTFNASASSDPEPGGEIVKYAWNFGDGSNGTGITTTHVYTAVGTYTVNLTVTDKDGLTDTFTTDVTVVLHDIAITNVTPSTSTATIGETVSINVTVVNEGTVAETFNVTVYYGDTIIGTQAITELASNASQLLIFSWDTSNVTAGTHTIKAVATTVPGETDTDDNTFTDDTVTVEEAQTLDILLYVAAAGAAAIIIAAVAIYFLKIRKPT